MNLIKHLILKKLKLKESNILTLFEKIREIKNHEHSDKTDSPSKYH